MNWEEIKTTVITFFQTSGLNILKAIGILLIGLVAIKIIVTIIKKVFRKTKMEKAAQGFLTSIIKVVLYLVLLFVIASVLGINTTNGLFWFLKCILPAWVHAKLPQSYLTLWDPMD